MHGVDAMRKKKAGNELGGIQKRSFNFRGNSASWSSGEAVLGWVREGVAPSRNGGPGVLPPENFLILLCCR
jgi:hypothetical protein